MKKEKLTFRDMFVGDVFRSDCSGSTYLCIGHISEAVLLISRGYIVEAGRVPGTAIIMSDTLEVTHLGDLTTWLNAQQDNKETFNS